LQTCEIIYHQYLSANNMLNPTLSSIIYKQITPEYTKIVIMISADKTRELEVIFPFMFWILQRIEVWLLVDVH
jgi:hypothetical protein